MATAMKLLLLSALLKMGACSCWFNGHDYSIGPPTGRRYLDNKEACFQPQCIDGNWEYKGQLSLNCGICLFGGEPLVFTFDNLINDPPGGRISPKITSNLISVDNSGEYVMTQQGIVDPSEFGVTGHFVSSPPVGSDAPAPGGPCGIHPYTNCIDGFIYYETGIAVKLQIINNIIKVYKSTTGYVKWGNALWDPSMVNSIDMTSGETTISVVGTVKILVIEVPVIIMGGRDCTIVIGSKGLTMWLCKEGAYSTPGYPWAGIYAMPTKGATDLQSTSAYPNKADSTTPKRLYGLCNSWTVKTAIRSFKSACFYRQDGQCMKNWQSGITLDHQTGANIRLLGDGLAGTWEVPP